MALLDGTKALVSGVANKKSIAWGIAQALYAHGCQIAFTCHPTNLRRLRKLAPQVDSEIIISCDVGQDEEIIRAFDQVGTVFDGKLDILVHSIAYANIDDLGGEFIKTSRAGWNLALDISAYSLVAFTRCARPLMNAARGGSIMTLTFGSGRVHPGYNIMGVAKAALEMTVRYLAYDLGPENIRVNAIESGPIQTISSQAIEGLTFGLRAMDERSPLLRNITLEDIGKTAVYLASEFSLAVTGAVIKVDSGINTMCPATVPHRKLKRTRDA